MNHQTLTTALAQWPHDSIVAALCQLDGAQLRPGDTKDPLVVRAVDSYKIEDPSHLASSVVERIEKQARVAR